MDATSILDDAPDDLRPGGLGQESELVQMLFDLETLLGTPTEAGQESPLASQRPGRRHVAILMQSS